MDLYLVLSIVWNPSSNHLHVAVNVHMHSHWPVTVTNNSVRQLFLD